ncbi:MAG: hypothetical protein BWX73_01728 [Lentisphaerae bacterium ADurb.Bin082]|nr:MAG: hypothetical protein BWX73_01728 [Lentisphaerae bacterium ADurb.Bin082]
MAYEFVYTSSPAGVRPGSSGFCVVACTQGLPAALSSQMEKLCAYKPYFPEYAEQASENPVSCAHCTLVCGGKTYYILSRICHNGRDYTGRSNKLASLIALERAELQEHPDGPASLFLLPGLFREADWEIRPEVLPGPLTLTPVSAPVGVATAWQAAGDAGWAGVLAESFLADPKSAAYLVFDPLRPAPTVELVHEALSLLPVERRWQVTFNTYFTSLTAGVSCHWRFCPPDSEALREASRRPGTIVLDLTAPLPEAQGGELVDFARSGERGAVAKQPVTTVTMPGEAVPKQKLKPLPPRRPMAGAARRKSQSAGNTTRVEREQPRAGKNEANSRSRAKWMALAIAAGAAIALVAALIVWLWLRGG